MDKRNEAFDQGFRIGMIVVENFHSQGLSTLWGMEPSIGRILDVIGNKLKLLVDEGDGVVVEVFEPAEWWDIIDMSPMADRRWYVKNACKVKTNDV